MLENFYFWFLIHHTSDWSGDDSYVISLSSASGFQVATETALVYSKSRRCVCSES